jgi:hypothetical protein
MSDLILEKSQSILIYRISFLTLVTTLYAIHRGLYSVSLLPVSIFLTSINFWRKPMYDYRRTLDIYVVNSSLSYHHYLAYNAQYANIYYMFIMLAYLSYGYSVYMFKRNKWLSTFAHMVLHVLINIACIILYSGNTPPTFYLA